MGDRRLRTDFVILVLGDGFGKLVSFLVYSRLARVLEPEAYGGLEFVMAIAVVGALAVDLGLAPFGARAIAQDPSSASRTFGRILALRGLMLGAVAAVLGVCALLAHLRGDSARAALFLFSVVVVVPKAAWCEWLFQGRGEMATVTATLLLEPLCALLLTIASVHAPADLPLAPVLLALAAGAVAAAQHLIARRRGIAPDVRGGIAAAKETLRAALPFGSSAIAWAARFFSPVVALGLLGAPGDAGTFGAAHRLIVSVHAVVWLYFFNLLPAWSQAALATGGIDAAVRRSIPVSVAGAVALSAALALGAPLLSARVLYGPDYEPSIRLLQALSLVPALAWVSGNFRFGLIAAGLPRGDALANGAGAIVAVVAFVALPWRGTPLRPAEACVVFLAAEAVTLLVAWTAWRRRSGVPRARS